jgi:hypothetical protein
MQFKFTALARSGIPMRASPIREMPARDLAFARSPYPRLSFSGGFNALL